MGGRCFQVPFAQDHCIAEEYWHPNKWDLWWRLGRPLHGRKLPKIADQEKPCNQTRSPVLVSILRSDASIWWILFMRPESPFFDAHSIGEVSEFYKTFQSNSSCGGRKVLCVHGGRLGILMSSCWGGSRAIWAREALLMKISVKYRPDIFSKINIFWP